MSYATSITTHIYHKSIDKHLVGSLFTNHTPKLIKLYQRDGTSNLWYTIYANACLISKYATPVRFTVKEQLIIKEAFKPSKCFFDKYGYWVNFKRNKNDDKILPNDTR